MNSEVELKEQRVRAMMAEQRVDALLLQKVSSFAWATGGGASYINTASTTGTSQLLYTPQGRHLITSNIELPRLLAEEGLEGQGWQIHAPQWYEPDQTIAELSAGLKLGADGPYPNAVDLSAQISLLRRQLTPAEQERFRKLGRICAEAMDAAIRRVKPGLTEFEIAAILGEETQQRGAQPVVNLIATDSNVFKYRHPLPTDKQMDQYAMLVLCGRKWGLVVSITRLVHYGLLPAELRTKMQAVAQVDAAFIAATRPGATLDQIFRRAQTAYAAAGFPDEWQYHHQGGPATYEPREIIATPHTTATVIQGEAYAWNPSIKGTKCEDTILIGETENEVLTTIERWPTVRVAIEGKHYARPAILEIV